MRKELKMGNGWFALAVILFVIIIAAVISYSGFFGGHESSQSYEYGTRWVKTEPSYVKGVLALLVVIFGFISFAGLVVLNPNEGVIYYFAGNYKGECQKNGFWFTNPFYGKSKITLRSQNFEIKPLKVNDKEGNPIEIGAVLVFKVEDMYKSTFDVEDAEKFLSAQSEAALRKIAGKYEYNSGDTDGLSSSNEGIKGEIIKEINSHIEKAGLIISDANITHLAYAPEIAAAMLQKQQAKAIVAARQTIVDGAVNIVKDAIGKVETEKISEFTTTEKARLVSNLLVVICGDKSPMPTVSVE